MSLLDQQERDSLTLFLRGEASAPQPLLDSMKRKAPSLDEDMRLIRKALSFMEIEEAHRGVIEEIRK